MQAQHCQAAGQRVGEPRKQEHVGRAGEDEPAGNALAVDRGLERAEELGYVLHFIENRATRQAGDEPTGSLAAASSVVWSSNVK
jgi:hypothetical protein